MTLYFQDTEQPHWVISDDGEMVYQAYGIRVTYQEVLEEDQSTTWVKLFDFYSGTDLSQYLADLYSSQPTVVEQMFPEGPPLPETPGNLRTIWTPDPDRMDISKTNVTVDSSTVTIDQITV